MAVIEAACRIRQVILALPQQRLAVRSCHAGAAGPCRRLTFEPFNALEVVGAVGVALSFCHLRGLHDFTAVAVSAG